MHYLSHVAIVRYCVFLIDVEVFFEQFLQGLVSLQVIIFQSKNLKSLFFGNETALDPESLLGNLLSTFIGELLASEVVLLPLEEFEDFPVSFRQCQRTNCDLLSILRIVLILLVSRSSVLVIELAAL